MSVTADMVRDLIVAHDDNRPRSKQTTVGPSDLSSPCDRRIGYKMLGVEPLTARQVNLAAWVGTGIHSQMEAAIKNHPDWRAEQKVSIEVSKGLTLAGTLDAYHTPSKTIVDWKSVGPSALAKYRQRTPDNYLTQVAIYGLLAILTGQMPVTHTAVAFIPRNGALNDIHVDVHPWDEARAEAAIRRYEALNSAIKAGPSVLPLLPVVHDCRFCEWWYPGSDNLTTGCPGQPPTDTTPQIAAWEPQEKAGARP